MKIYKMSHRFERYMRPLYRRKSIYIAGVYILALFLYFIEVTYWYSIGLITVLTGTVVTILIMGIRKRGRLLYIFNAIILENKIRANIIDSMLVNTAISQPRIKVPDIIADFSNYKHSISVTIEKVATTPIERLSEVVSMSFKGYYLKGYTVVELSENRERTAYNFILTDVSKSNRIKASKIGDIVSEDYYKLKIMKGLELPISHLILSAKTGGGKSFFLMGLLLQMLYKHTKEDDEKGTGLYLFDSKQEFSALTFYKHRIYSDTSEYIEKMRDIVKILEAREKEFTSKVTEKMSLNYTDYGMRAIIVVVEELSATVGAMDTKQRKEWDNLTGQILLKGRQLGLFYWTISQSFHSDTIKVGHRNQFPFRVLLGANLASDDISYIFGNNDSTIFSTGEKYTGFYTYEGVTNAPRKIEPTDITKINNLKVFEEAYKTNY